MAAVMFLYQITVFYNKNTTATLLELYFNDSMQTVYARGGGSCGSRQRQVADGADVVFTDTLQRRMQTSYNFTLISFNYIDSHYCYKG